MAPLTLETPAVRARRNQPGPAPTERRWSSVYDTLLRQAILPHAMKIDLADLLPDLPVLAQTGPASCVIHSLATDSRRIAPGALFFAVTGYREDGNAYVMEAIQRGAAAVVSEKIQTVPPRCAFIQVADLRQAMAVIARRFYNHPERGLRLFGVTGTNGKTTVSTLLKFFLEKPGLPVGLLGTVSYQLGARTLPAGRTTPDSIDLQGLLAQMREAGCQQAVMEVSSHSLDQRRVQDLAFHTAAFTNLTRDHLDYHQTMERYFEAKQRLFDGRAGPLPAHAVINGDDPWGRRLLETLPSGLRAVTFGESACADFRATEVRLLPRGTDFLLTWPEGSRPVSSPLLGSYNVSNLLAALAMAWTAGEAVPGLLDRLASFPGVPGRMERIEVGQTCTVLVDYAHTDDALDNALRMLRQVARGRLLVVFGCGGNRDRSKRPLMTAAVLRHADLAWATADNPRHEAIEAIFTDMRPGATGAGDRLFFVEDRRRAISRALDAARPEDTVLIAGKGHETYQEFAGTIVPFDDRAVAAELLRIKISQTPK